MDVDLREWELVAPPNDPHPMLTPTDDYESIPATRIQLVVLPSEQAAMHSHTSTYVVSTDLTQEDLAETPTAAPAARRRLFFMGWNAGGGARQLPRDVLEEKEYEFFAIQEAHVEQMRQLGTTHNFVVQENQCIAACSLGSSTN